VRIQLTFDISTSTATPKKINQLIQSVTTFDFTDPVTGVTTKLEQSCAEGGLTTLSLCDTSLVVGLVSDPLLFTGADAQLSLFNAPLNTFVELYSSGDVALQGKLQEASRHDMACTVEDRSAAGLAVAHEGSFLHELLVLERGMPVLQVLASGLFLERTASGEWAAIDNFGFQQKLKMLGAHGKVQEIDFSEATAEGKAVHASLNLPGQAEVVVHSAPFTAKLQLPIQDWAVHDYKHKIQMSFPDFHVDLYAASQNGFPLLDLFVTKAKGATSVPRGLLGVALESGSEAALSSFDMLA
jgi:hypothetical protein